MMSNYYEILELPTDATVEKIKEAYRRLAKQYHPDINPGYTKAFQEISEAYNTLSDPQKRTQYDYSNGFNAKKPSQQARNSFYSTIHDFGRTTHYEPFNFIYREFVRDAAQNITITVPVEKAYVGGNVMVKVNDMTIPVNIRAKSMPDTVMHVASRFGEMRATLKVVDSEKFRLVGNDIETTCSITLKQAILGDEIIIFNPANERYTLKIPPGVKPNTIFNFKNEGLGNNNLRVKIEIIIPKCATGQELLAFQKEVSGWAL